MEEQAPPEIEKPGQELADILSSYGEEHGFDAQTCEEVADMEFEEAFETSYGYLSQAGLDPDEVLASFMEEPANEE